MGSLVIVKYSSSHLFLLFGLILFVTTTICLPLAALIIWTINIQSVYGGAYIGILVVGFLEASFWVIKEDNKKGEELPPFSKEDEDNQRQDDENKDL